MSRICERGPWVRTMLLELQIHDFAIIDHLQVVFDSGFHVLSGETGAGKSIIIDALGMVRGDKPDITFVRTGAARARIEAVFLLDDCPAVMTLLQTYDLGTEGDDHVILTREISAESGRSAARINRRPVNVGVLREIGSQLVDIHGQYQGLSLFHTRTHLDMLDRYGELMPLREDLRTLVEQLRTVRAQLAATRQSEATRLARINDLQLLIDDVAAVSPSADEMHGLLQERNLLQHAVRITELATQSYARLVEGDEHERYPRKPILDELGIVVGQLAELARLDPSVTPLAEQITDLFYHFEDIATNVRAYRDSLDFDPARLDLIEDRLAQLRKLERTYDGTLAEIIARAAAANTEIEHLSHHTEHIQDLETQEAALLQNMSERASDLSRRRHAASQALSVAIEEAMRDLAMPHVRFAVQLRRVADDKGLVVPAVGNNAVSERVAFDPTGIDRVQFLIAPNLGESLKPLAKIASGGESARLLLALKSILSHVDTIPTLVFDEIDVGVGGRAGQVVGQKLWSMATRHQVLCITHLPQVAAFADSHFAIQKEVVQLPDNTLRTRTRVDLLSVEERIEEIAAMLDGTPVQEQSRASARLILDRAAAMKAQVAAAAYKTMSPAEQLSMLTSLTEIARKTQLL